MSTDIHVYVINCAINAHLLATGTVLTPANALFHMYKDTTHTHTTDITLRYEVSTHNRKMKRRKNT